MSNTKVVRLLTLGAAVLVAVLIAFGGRFALFHNGSDTPGGPVAGSAVGKAAIGGPFELVDQEGRTVTQAAFAGRLMLVSFGYTYCPDVCPTAMQTMSGALDLLGEEAKKVAPVFVSVDPQRDTPAQLKDFVANFHPSFTGLTGTPEQVAKAARAYRVYYAKVMTGEGKDDYLMDHSAFIYLMGPDGQYLAHFSHDTKPEAMAKRIRDFL